MAAKWSASTTSTCKWKRKKRRDARPRSFVSSPWMLAPGAPFAADANDFLYQWDASRDYDPGPGLERIRAPVLVVNSADDERNPPETGILERELARLKNARLHLIPASEDTAGHGTVGIAKFWKRELQSFLQELPRRS